MPLVYRCYHWSCSRLCIQALGNALKGKQPIAPPVNYNPVDKTGLKKPYIPYPNN